MTDSRRDFLKKSVLLSGATGLSTILPASVQKAFAIDPSPGSTYLDAEHIVILMQENRSFDHCFGTLQGVRGFNDPRAITLPDGKPVWCQTNEKGETYAPFRLDLKDSKVTWMGALPHSRPSQVDAWNKGKYDQWLPAKRSGHKEFKEMPLTMGYVTRQDIPFNYAMADAFTVCDQNFCSAMTSTTPNRSFFWTGKISTEVDGVMQAHIRNDNYSYGKLGWKTFPEYLQENGIEWKFYQNDISCGGGFKGEERSWLANFGCNLLEFFAAYNVKFSKRYVESLIKQIDTLPEEINKLQEASPSTEDAARKNRESINKKQAALDNAKEEFAKWNKESYEKLTGQQKQLFNRAFVNNAADPDFHKLTALKYKDGKKERKLNVPEGDLFYQFRKDVNEGKLPTVSWLASPQNFSDHPSAPWYGAWYVSEILDILTNNEEVWKKTIFILTYDENDGYYDHVPPYSICDNKLPGTGKCSPSIDTEIEHVRLDAELKQGLSKKNARESPIGLGFRVPLVVASPWSRGGKVCSQLFEHTSTLQFLETFINQKFKKNIHAENISNWRRAISGDLTSVFSPFDGSKPKPLPFIEQHKIVEDIYNAKFKNLPNGYREISDRDANEIAGKGLRLQEKGTRPSCALPYELYADANKEPGSSVLKLQLKAGNKIFGKKSAGAPFTAYAPAKFKGELNRNWSFALVAGDQLDYDWNIQEFDDNNYRLRVGAPNGFYREFVGDANDPSIHVSAKPEVSGVGMKPTGNLVVQVKNLAASPVSILVADNAYGNKSISREIAAKSTVEMVLPLSKSKGWYDWSMTVKGEKKYLRRYAGRVEDGKESLTDPFMGGEV